MKKTVALALAVISGLYLLIWGPMVGPLDPIPIVDEGIALVVLLNSLAYLGIDLRRFFGKKGGKRQDNGEPIDID